MENESTSGKLHPANPFHVIPCGKTERVKIWDFRVETFTHDLPGRVRILAVVPKKPEPLTNIKFSVAWCSPSDVKQFNRDKANKILIGRYLSQFVEGKTNKNCGVVKSIDSLEAFQVAAFNALENVPNWIKDVDVIMQRTGNIVVDFDEKTFEVQSISRV